MTLSISKAGVRVREWSGSIIRVLVQTHLWVGLGAGVQTWLGFKAAFGGPLTPDEQLYVGVAGVGAAGFYTIYRGWGRRLSERQAAWDWAFTLGIAMLAVAGIRVTELPPAYWALLVPPVAIAGVYATARYRGGNAPWFGLAKPILLAAVWTWVVAYVPMVRSGDIDVPLLSSRACFFLAIALVSDHKDNDADFDSGLSSLTWRLGRSITVAVTLALMVAAGALALVGNAGVGAAAAAFAGAGFLGVLLLGYAFRQNPRAWYYDGVVDGLLVLTGVFYLALRATWASG